MDKEIYSSDEQQVYSLLDTSPDGLGPDAFASRLEEYGQNVLQQKAAVPLWKKIVAQFTHTLAILLWVAGIFAIASDQLPLGIACFLVIIVNAAFSFFQEFRAEKAVESLSKILPRKSRVMRGGEEVEIEADDLVPGDIMLLEAGNSVSADARLVQSSEMRVDNSAITGESEPQMRRPEAIYADHPALADIPNLVFAGSSVSNGSGKAVIYATGMNTEIGKIARLTQSVKEEKSPLQVQLTKVSHVIAAIAVSVGVVFFFLGYFVVHLGRAAAFTFAIGLIVANVPEGLLPTVSLALAIGTQRMAKRHALIKKLSSVETLGSTTVICTDKTGTLTTNEMTVRQVWIAGRIIEVTGAGYKPEGDFTVDGGPAGASDRAQVLELARVASLCNNSKLLPPNEEREKWSILGDPTEGALLVLARKVGFDYRAEGRHHSRWYELPFDSRRKLMTTINRRPAEKGESREQGRSVEAFVKGAPNELLARCTHIWQPGGSRPLTDEDRKTIDEQNDSYALQALRVLAFARRDMGTEQKHYEMDETERDLTFVGLAAMLDPPRPEVEEALELCRKAGIRVIMITGDYGLTAESIARQIRLVEGPDVRVVSGTEIDRMTDGELGHVLASESQLIFARVSPEHKMRVAKALKTKGDTVAMTGDGVNDAPALKAADIGISMGITGTDVAREASEMILTDDNFASIVNAIEEGRGVYDNIRRFITYFLTHNIAEAIPYLLFVLVGIPLPLLVMQILAIDLGSDLIPGLALGSERPEPDVMTRPPRPRNERLLNAHVIARAYGWLGFIEGILCMSSYFLVFLLAGWRPSLGVHAMATKGNIYMMATTACFAGIIMTQIGNGFSCRSTRESIFKVGFFTNRFYLWGIISEVSVMLALIYIPGLRNIFGNAPVSGWVWLFMLSFPVVIFFAEEGRKAVVRAMERKRTGETAPAGGKGLFEAA